MYLNGFSVRIPKSNELPGGYVELEHNQQYILAIRNARTVRCDAYVEIDGKHVGTWRLERGQSISLERPAHDDGKFTFYKLGTSEARQVGLSNSNPDIGLVKVVFTPEKIWEPRPIVVSEPVIYRSPTNAEPCWNEGITYATASCSGEDEASTDSIDYNVLWAGHMSAGGTGLSGQSRQIFGQASSMFLDYSAETTIHLRLVCKNDTPRPLTSFSTPIPPRV